MKNKDLAGCILVDKKNNVLLQKKTLDYKIAPGGYWCIFGGEIKKGETPEQAVIREVAEETGYVINNQKLFCTKDYVLKNGEHGKLYAFTAPFNGNLSQISLREGAGFAFFSASELSFIKVIETSLDVLKEYFKI